MKVIINGIEANLTPEDVEQLQPSFSLLHGRRFSLKAQNSDKLLSLNQLILAVKKAAEPEKNVIEIKNFIKAFEILTNKGYEAPDNQISKENFVIRIITNIKHFFAKIKREISLMELNIADKAIYTKFNNYLNNNDIKNAEALLMKVDNADEFLNGKRLSDGSYDIVSSFLSYAIEQNKHEMVALLLKFKADPNAAGRAGTPLLTAIKAGNLETIKLLLENKLDLSDPKIFLKAAENKNFLDIIECLLQYGMDPNPKTEFVSPLALLAVKWNKNPEKVKTILEKMLAAGAKLIPEDETFKGKIPQECVDFLKTRGIKDLQFIQNP